MNKTVASDRGLFPALIGDGTPLIKLTGVCLIGSGLFAIFLSLWQTLALVGLFGFGTAIGVHYPIGYTDPIHLAPAYLGAGLFLSGMAFSYSAAFGKEGQSST